MTQIKGQKDDDLLLKVGGTGFPHVVAMDERGKVLATLKGGRDVDGFEKMMKTAREYTELRAKAEKGDPEARGEFFLRGLKIGEFTSAEARKYYESLKDLSDEQKTQMEGELVGLEVREVLEPVKTNRERSKTKELELEAGKKFLEMRKAGRIPSKVEEGGPFFSLILGAAEQAKDIPLFEKALEELKERFGNKVRQLVQAKERVLERLKSEKEEEPKEKKE